VLVDLDRLSIGAPKSSGPWVCSACKNQFPVSVRMEYVRFVDWLASI
jgi:hypothetical protein